MPADVQMNHGSSDAHVQWFSHCKIRADFHDVMIRHHEDVLCYRGRELQKENTSKPRGCCLGILVLSIRVH